MIAVTFFLLAQGVSASTAFPQGLSVPVGCTIGKDCLVQKLVDLQPGLGRRDYRCGTLTTEEHDGIDIRLRTMADLDRNVPVLAAAAGVVARVRDGEADIAKPDGYVANGRDAGNGVVIDHGGGWETQYSHLHRGSVVVRPGQRVKAGDRLGSIGLSGRTEYPHVHFTVRLDGTAIDPFTGASPPAPCLSGGPTHALWSHKAAQALTYRPTAVISAGFANGPPDKVKARAGQLAGSQLPRDGAALVLWADVIGAQAGDTQHFMIRGPGGQVVLDQRNNVDKGGLSWFGYGGRRTPPGGWPAGGYKGRYELERNGTVVASYEAATILK